MPPAGARGPRVAAGPGGRVLFAPFPASLRGGNVWPACAAGEPLVKIHFKGWGGQNRINGDVLFNIVDLSGGSQDKKTG